MTTRATVIFLTVLSVVAGCDGGSGSAPRRFKFRTFNVSECREFTADIDLEAASAVLARLDDNSPDCRLSSVLDGCDSLFQEVEDGRKLRVTIANCILPLNTALFDCGFKQAEVKTLEASSDAYCECLHQPVCDWNSVCNAGPPLCVNEEGGVAGCEACANGVDDNGDGKVDCADDDCRITEVCGWGWTTVTCPNTTYENTTLPTTDTTMPTTDTTLPVDGCQVVFRLPDAVKVGAIGWDTTYSGGTFLGTFGHVQCENLASGALASFSDLDSEKKLKAGLISLDGIQGPTDLASCTFVASVTPVPSDFHVVVTDAADTESHTIEPAPEVIVGSIDCGFGPAAPSLQRGTTSD